MGWTAGKARGTPSDEVREKIRDTITQTLARKKARQDLQSQIVNALRYGQEDQAYALLEDLVAFDAGSEMITNLGTGFRARQALNRNAEVQARMADARMDDVMHEPYTGIHNHPHAAFGAADGVDGFHAHNHRHFNDNEHAHFHGGK